MQIIFKLFALIPFYLIGAIPSGHLISKAYGIDISRHGSGNVGATNVARIIGKKPGLFTLIVDVLKGLTALLIAGLVTDDENFIGMCAFAVICGHCFSLPQLKGGKGVATALGVTFYYSLTLAFACLGIFALVLYFTKYVSLASVVAVASAPLMTMLTNFKDSTSMTLICISIIVIYRHKDNLMRLVEGRESKLQS